MQWCTRRQSELLGVGKRTKILKALRVVEVEKGIEIKRLSFTIYIV